MLIGTMAEATRFARSHSQLWLARLCGLPTGRQGEDTGPVRTQGMTLLQVDGRRYEGSSLTLDTMEETDQSLQCRWLVGATPLRLTTCWQGCPGSGIVSRRDTLTNTGDTAAVLSRCLARVSFPPGRYECYSQSSRWCHENQGGWQPLHTGVTLHHVWGRTTEESTPYLALRAFGAETGLAFHVLPHGNWTIQVSTVAEGGDLPYAVVELGLADENLQRTLAPGETFTLPEILIQPLPRGEPHLGAPALHRYLLARHFAGAKPEAPVVYNTWFDQFEILDVPRLQAQLAAAAAGAADPLGGGADSGTNHPALWPHRRRFPVCHTDSGWRVMGTGCNDRSGFRAAGRHARHAGLQRRPGRPVDGAARGGRAGPRLLQTLAALPHGRGGAHADTPGSARPPRRLDWRAIPETGRRHQPGVRLPTRRLRLAAAVPTAGAQSRRALHRVPQIRRARDRTRTHGC